MPLFAIVAYDKTDDEAPNRRRTARTAHFERMKEAVDHGLIHFAGSMIDENGTMKCSIIICDFLNRTQLDQWVAEEPYVKNGAWHRIEVAPLFSAVENGTITESWLNLMKKHISAT